MVKKLNALQKTVVMFTWLVVVGSMIPISQAIAGMTAAEKAVWVKAQCNGTPVDPWNDYIAVQVDSSGTFNIGAFQPTPWDLLYTWPDTPGTSFTTVRVDSADYTYGDIFAPGTVSVQPPYDADALTNVSIWQVGDVIITQTLQITTGTTTGNPDTIKIQYDAKNVGEAPHEVGLRVMMDTEINYNDGAPFRIPGLADAVTTELELFPPDIPQYYQAFFDLNDPQHVAQGTLRGGGATLPDRFVMASWSEIAGTLWEYEVTPEKIFGTIDYPDSAVALYWNPIALLPGESRSYVTYYGLGGISGSVDLSISGPAQLEIFETQWSPNPFTVVAYLKNNTGLTMTGDSLTLDLSGAAGLVFAQGEAATHALLDILPGETTQTSWSVLAMSPGTWSYAVSDAASPPVTAARSIIVPEITAECGPHAVEACQTDLPGVCARGTRTCTTAGNWDVCVAAHPVAEVCGDGLDNDCDGLVDQADSDCWECIPPTTQTCATNQLGVCAQGLQTCSALGLWGACVAAVQPVAEVCGDGLDNDCDGLVDGADEECKPRDLDCRNAFPSVANVWPPDKSMIPVLIGGVTGSDGAPAVVTVEGVTQDESVSGNKAPDAAGVGTEVALVRADRLGNGNGGRVYVISFAARESSGGACRGSVSVCVPHDREQRSCIDDGQIFDSTSTPPRPGASRSR